MELTEAVKIIRKELCLMDEPLKAYRLLETLNIPELEELKKKSYGMCALAFDESMYRAMYNMNSNNPMPEAELIEPRELIKNAGIRYPRYAWVISEISKMDKDKTTYMDLACYIGSLVTTVGSLGIKSTGVDMTARAIEIAKERALSEHIENVEFFCADITKFDKVKATVISAFEVIEHVVDPVQFIKHLLSIGEIIYISTPNGCFDKGRGNMGHWEWDGVPIHMRGHLRVFTLNSLKELVESCGGVIESIEEKPDNLIWCKFRKG